MGAALFKRGWGCQIELPPRTTAPRGRLPGRWRSRTASGRRGGCIGIRVRVRATRIRAHVRASALPSPTEAFSIKINSGGWLRAPLRAPLLADRGPF